MTFLAQPFYYWVAAFVLVIMTRTYIRAFHRERRHLRIDQERLARVAEDHYWHNHRDADLQLAARITAHRYSDRLLELLDENDQRRDQRLKVVT